MSLRLELVDVHAEIEGKEILKGVSLTVEQGRFHALMGPNGSGKTTLSRVIMGDRRYKITKGSILLDGEDITNLPAHERARKGLFLTFQNPVELPGVKLFTLIRSSYLVHHPDDKRSFQEFITYVQSKARLLGMDTSLLSRGVNEGFSGGERKKSEILQMSLIKPRIAIIDEIDSGLDVDALEAVAKSLKDTIYTEPRMGVLLITHYQRILKYLAPDTVHVMMDGRIIKSGDYSLALKIEERGYEWIREAR
ncbi:MAG: Fe-S cluster assembly ATPase SufC [Thermoplasmata archaeon]|jgi:Fe-S cluster assembly ATP-binding protein|nr:Fe-S cluster assembly ATPase SufC [Thermoplasmatales archaeon]